MYVATYTPHAHYTLPRVHHDVFYGQVWGGHLATAFIGAYRHFGRHHPGGSEFFLQFIQVTLKQCRDLQRNILNNTFSYTSIIFYSFCENG